MQCVGWLVERRQHTSPHDLKTSRISHPRPPIFLSLSFFSLHFCNFSQHDTNKGQILGYASRKASCQACIIWIILSAFYSHFLTDCCQTLEMDLPTFAVLPKKPAQASQTGEALKSKLPTCNSSTYSAFQDLRIFFSDHWCLFRSLTAPALENASPTKDNKLQVMDGFCIF